ncbi:hypothetical protein UFOVP1290_155 [uncultured Caudovirales phage]|uniref:Uncharacterized protein n=1 Tax=uncultured Caudovirales phage TaxID=2100421 RepID=A0A6J5RWJ7_9CAUD|nr:hypothetical protein UFOVP1290_155 [uncultured Caudovirales phage]
MKKKLVKPDVVSKILIAVKDQSGKPREVAFDYELTWKHICALLPTYNASRHPVITVFEDKTVVRSGDDLGSGGNLAEAMQSALAFLRTHASKTLEIKSAEVAKLRAAMGFVPEEE